MMNFAVMDQDAWWFSDPEECPSQTWACHMKAISSCRADSTDLGEDYSSATALRLGSSVHLQMIEELALTYEVTILH